MKKVFYILIMSLLFITVVSTMTYAEGSLYEVYVSTSGSDTTGNGSATKPYRTIQKGINMIIGGYSGVSTRNIYIKTGTYYENIIMPDLYGISWNFIAENGTVTLDGQGSGILIDWPAPSNTNKVGHAHFNDFIFKNSTTAIRADFNADQSNFDRRIYLTNCIFENNTNGIFNDGGHPWSLNHNHTIYPTEIETYIDKCIFRNNSSWAIFSGEGTGYITRSRFIGNGNVLDISYGYIDNCIISNNTGQIVGSSYNLTDIWIRNCTIYNNHSTTAYSLIVADNLDMRNTIFYNNSVLTHPTKGYAIIRFPNSEDWDHNTDWDYSKIWNCDIQSNALTYINYYIGLGQLKVDMKSNIDADPLFVETSDTTSSQYLKIAFQNSYYASKSPCIDTGTPVESFYTIPAITDDIEEKPRPNGTNHDIGAFESYNVYVKVITPAGGEIYDRDRYYNQSTHISYGEEDKTIPVKFFATTNQNTYHDGIMWALDISYNGGSTWSPRVAWGYGFPSKIQNYIFDNQQYLGDNVIIKIKAKNTSYPDHADYETFVTSNPFSVISHGVYVSPGGSDSNSGSEYSPYKTLQRAINIVQPNGYVLPAAGTYTIEASEFTNGGVINWPNKDNITIAPGRTYGISYSFDKPVILEPYNVRVTIDAEYNGKGINVGYPNIDVNLTNITIKNASTEADGGAISLFDNNNLSLNNVVIDNCKAGAGGAVFSANSSVEAINSIFSNNSSSGNGGVASLGYWNTVNCVFYNNKGNFGGVAARNKYWRSVNSIYWANTSEVASDVFFALLPEAFDITSSDLQLTNNTESIINIIGNFSKDPLFVDPSNHDFHLQSGSLCLDNGINTAPGVPAKDIEGNTRISLDTGSFVDLGPHEHDVPHVYLNSPIDGSTYEGTDIEITWNSANSKLWLMESVTIEYSQNNGETWITIAADEYNDGYYLWENPGTNAEEAIFAVNITGAGPNKLLGRDENTDPVKITWPTAYVDPNGDDKYGTGSISHPYKTIHRALEKIPPHGEIRVNAGIYTTDEAYYPNALSYFIEWPDKQGITLKAVNGRATIDAGSFGGGIAVKNFYTDLTIEGFTIQNASSEGSGGGISLFYGSVLKLKDVIINNCTAGAGGAVYADTSTVEAINCIFSNNNSIANGGAVSLGEWTVINSLFYNNRGNLGGVADRAKSWRSINSAYWNNSAAVDAPVFFSMFIDTIDMEYSVIQGDTLITELKDTNIITDPKFKDPINGDYHLGAGSSGLDSGTSEAEGLPLYDIVGNNRFYGLAVDIGPHENKVPSINILTPADGSSHFGTDIEITWKTTSEFGFIPNTVTIEYSTDNGSTWKVLVSEEVNDGYYLWKDPETNSDQTIFAVNILGFGYSEIELVRGENRRPVQLIWPFAHVSPTGDDVSGNGSSTYPYKTIHKALEVVPASGEVRVFPGVYSTDEAYYSSPLSYFIEWPNKQDITLKAINGRATIDAEGFGGGIIVKNFYVNLSIEGFTIQNASIESSGGGISLYYGSTLNLKNVIVNNCVADTGGAVFADTSTVEAVNCVFSNNKAVVNGGAASLGYWNTTNCLFYNNSSFLGGGIARSNSWVSKNSVYWNNTAIGAPLFFAVIPDSINITNSIVQSNTDLTELLDLNLSIDPKFIDPANINFYLQDGSPCIDNGSNLVANLPEKDIAGNNRQYGVDVDIGPYEKIDGTSIKLFSPVSGSIYNGIDIDVIWAASTELGFLPNSVTIEYSTDNGTNWTILTSNEANDGYYLWEEPETNANEALFAVNITAVEPTEFVAGRYELPKPVKLIWNVVYVDTTGSDTSGNGSRDYPYKTIHKALQVVPVTGEVRVYPGIYTTNEAYFNNSLDYFIDWPNKQNITLKAIDGRATIDAGGFGGGK